MSEQVTRGRVLVVEDEPALLRSITRALTRNGFEVTALEAASPAIAMLRNDCPDVVLTDLHLPDALGTEVLAAARATDAEAMVIVMTGLATVASAVEAMRLGAYDYLTKPFDHVDVIVRAVERALEKRRLIERNRFLERRVGVAERFQGIVGASKAMRDVFALIESVAAVDTTVLVTGESGTGKELVVRAIHERSPRRSRPFVAINCGALAESILESELFGHTKGSFTGAVSARRGLFEEASGGSIFLDEVGELPPSMQVKLLRVLQEHEVKPVGSNESRKVDVRVLGATHRDLAAAVHAGTFREDLFYRLHVISVKVAPLRERSEDIPLLAYHFMKKHADRYGREASRIEGAALERLTTYAWPGNVRELENVIERAVVLAKGDVLGESLFPPALRGAPTDSAHLAEEHAAFDLPLTPAKEAFERNYVQAALLRASGNIGAAARAAGIDRSNFKRLMKRHGIVAEGFKDDEPD